MEHITEPELTLVRILNVRTFRVFGAFLFGNSQWLFGHRYRSKTSVTNDINEDSTFYSELAMDFNTDAVRPFFTANDMDQAYPHLIILQQNHSHQQRQCPTKFQPSVAH